MRDLIKAALRMRPTRLIIGEVRGAEAFELLTCLNTGHDGSLSTCHANSTADTITRLETMVLMGMVSAKRQCAGRHPGNRGKEWQDLWNTGAGRGDEAD